MMRNITYKLALVVLTLAVLPLLYLEAWLGLGSALVAYALAAKLANQDMDRAFLIRTLKGRAPAIPSSAHGAPANGHCVWMKFGRARQATELLCWPNVRLPQLNVGHRQTLVGR